MEDKGSSVSSVPPVEEDQTRLPGPNQPRKGEFDEPERYESDMIPKDENNESFYREVARLRVQINPEFNPEEGWTVARGVEVRGTASTACSCSFG
jgi:hypothetical protein